MKLTEYVKHRMHLVTNLAKGHGDAFFNEFDTTFGLQPVSEFAYLLRYV